MNHRTTIATIRRVLAQLAADPRTIALILAVPAFLVTVLRFVYDGSPELFDRIAVTMTAVLPMMMMFLVTSVAMLRERTSGTLERLMTTRLHRADLLAGYGVAFTGAAVAQALVLAAVTHLALGVDTAAPIAWLPLIAAFSATVGVGVGLLASAFARTEFQAVQFMPVFVGPQIFLCGLLAPLDAMPRALEIIARAMPMTYAVEAAQTVGTSPDVTGTLVLDLAVVAAFAVVAIALAAASMPRSTR